MIKRFAFLFFLFALVVSGLVIYQKSKVDYPHYFSKIKKFNQLKELEILLDEDVLFVKANRIPNHKNFELHNSQIEIVLREIQDSSEHDLFQKTESLFAAHQFKKELIDEFLSYNSSFNRNVDAIPVLHESLSKKITNSKGKLLLNNIINESLISILHSSTPYFNQFEEIKNSLIRSTLNENENVKKETFDIITTLYTIQNSKLKIEELSLQILALHTDQLAVDLSSTYDLLFKQTIHKSNVFKTVLYIIVGCLILTIALLLFELSKHITHIKKDNISIKDDLIDSKNQTETSQQWFQKYLDALPNGVFIYGQNNVITYINEKGRKLLNINSSSCYLDSKIRSKFTYEDTLEPFLSQNNPFKLALSGKKCSEKNIFLKINDIKVKVNLHLTPLQNSNNKVENVIGFIEAHDQSNLSQKEKKESSIKINELNKDHKIVLERIEELIGNQIDQLDVLVRNIGKADSKDLIETIEDSKKELKATINNINDLSKRDELFKETFELIPAINDKIKLFLAMNGHVLYVDKIDPAIPVKIQAEKKLFLELFDKINYYLTKELNTNAIEFNLKILDLATERLELEVSFHFKSNQSILEIQNTIEYLNIRKRARDIGTSIFLTFYEDMYYLKFNLSARYKTIDSKQFKPSNKKILLADDKEIHHLIIKQLLKPYGLNIDYVEDGNQAIKLLKKNQYDLIMLDTEMPHYSGLEVCNHIRATDPETPVVILKTSPSHQFKQECYELGVNEVLSKPFLPEEIESVSLRLLKISTVSSDLVS